MKIRLLLALIAIATTSACATPPRFEWGQYENSLYTYYKKPELRDRYETSLLEAIRKGEATNRVAPGLYAEIGYLRYQDGDIETAVSYFQKEKALFPESAVFMNSVISRLKQAEEPGNAAVESGDDTENGQV